jgi:glycosyltransferase involved in cell wall biosynthesis
MSQSDHVLYPYPGPQLVRGTGVRPAPPAPWQAAAAADAGSAAPVLSLIAPVYNEVENLRALHARVVEVLAGKVAFELVLVDDGSRDGSGELIRELAAADPRVRGVLFERNCGQTAATAAGLAYARGRLLATIDADMQNDPGDLPGMLERLGQHDAVVGFRIKRNDNLVRRVSSRVANRLRNWISQDQIRDTGCSLKLFRAEAIRSIPLFEGMHRFLPTLLRYHGFSVIEHGVSHHPRTQGVSKYGVWNRAFKAARDLFAVRWMRGRRLVIPVREVVGSESLANACRPAARPEVVQASRTP